MSKTVGQVFETSCFGVCQIVAVLDVEPSPEYEVIPLEFDHPAGTCTVLDEDLIAKVNVEEVVCCVCGIHFLVVKTPDEALIYNGMLCNACSNGGEGGNSDEI